MAKPKLDDEQKIAALINLSNSEGWLVIRQELEDNIKELGESLLNDVWEEMSEKDRRLTLIKRHLQRSFLDLPTKLIAKYQSEEPQQEEDFDPFE